MQFPVKSGTMRGRYRLPREQERELSPISTAAAPDGTRLATYRWDTDAVERRGVYILHGLSEYAGRYDRLARWLNARGWQVAAHDHRGHGRSDGPRASLRQADDLVADAVPRIEAFARGLDRAPVLLGHSMGAAVAALVALRRLAALEGLVLCSPPFKVGVSRWVRATLNLMADMAPDLRLRHRMATPKLSHDKAAVAAYHADPLVNRALTGRLARFIDLGGREALERAPTLDLPTLLLVAGDDVIVDPAGSREFADRAPAGLVDMRWYDGAWHELFNESPELAAPVYADLENWLAAIDAPAANGPIAAAAGHTS